jgi:hypothetical protein
LLTGTFGFVSIAGMRHVRLMALRWVFPITLLAQSGLALASEGWTNWELVYAETWDNSDPEKLARWHLMMNEDGRVSTSWVGPMYDWEAEGFATLEGLEAVGRYERDGTGITFTIEEVYDGWLWAFSKVTCAIAESETELRLTACTGYAPPPYAVDAAQPGDMSFRRSPDRP